MTPRTIPVLLAAMFAMGLFASTVEAQTVAFEGFPAGQLGVGVVNTEAGFEFETVSGGAWGIDGLGNPDQALWAGWQVALATGDEFSIRRADGQPFSFISVDHRSGGTQSDGVDFVGLVDGSEVASIEGFSRNDTAWLTLEPDFEPIDELRIVGASAGSAALVLDNFVFTLGDALFADRFETQ